MIAGLRVAFAAISIASIRIVRSTFSRPTGLTMTTRETRGQNGLTTVLRVVAQDRDDENCRHRAFGGLFRRPPERVHIAAVRRKAVARQRLVDQIVEHADLADLIRFLAGGDWPPEFAGDSH